jgi:spoIIIJ-associated protein
MVAMTEDDSPGQVPVGGDVGAGPAVSADETAADVGDSGDRGDTGNAGDEGDTGDAAQPGEPRQVDEPVGLGADGTDALGADGDDEEALDGGGDDEEAPDRRPRAVADLEQESEIAADYVEGLLDVADLDGDIDMDVEGDRALVSVVGATLQELVGPRGEVLEALQELTRLAVHRQTGVRTRIMLDVGGYRARRRTELTALGQDAAEDVSRTGVPRRLEPMTPFERKIIHDAVAAAGLRSESEGEEPNRRVVVLPAG